MASYTTSNSKFFFVAFLCVNLTCSAQYFHYSNMHENIFKLNPAYITKVEKLSFQLTYRNQWPGSSDFVTYDGSAIASSERLSSSAGTYIYRDVQGNGVINTTSFGLMYAYKTRIHNTWEVSAGISGSVNLYEVSLTSLTFADGSVPYAEDRNFTFANFSAGATFGYREDYTIGLSVSNLASLYTNNIALPGLQINLSFEGHYMLNKRYSQLTSYFDPLLWFSASSDHNELLYGGRFNFSGILAGIYARQDLKFNFDALILLLGTQIGNVEFYYTYDLNLSGASRRFSNLAAHEVTFLYSLEYKRKSKKRRGAIKCPDI